MKTKLKKILLIVILSILLAMVFNLFNSNSIDFSWQPISYIVSQEDNHNQSKDNSNISIKMISAIEAYQYYVLSKGTFVDARDHWDYSDGHIPGSINIAEYKFKENDPVVQSLDKNKLYVVYCSSTDCDAAKKLAAKLKLSGFQKLEIFEGGWKEWIANGFSIKVGSDK